MPETLQLSSPQVLSTENKKQTQAKQNPQYFSYFPLKQTCLSQKTKTKTKTKPHKFLAFSLEPNMSLLLFLLLFLISNSTSSSVPTTSELDSLMAIKHSLDPENRLLASWTPHSDTCLSFEGVACDEEGHVTNISLQGKGLSGRLPAAVGGLKSLTGLYLHFNALSGGIPSQIANLTRLTDLYLNQNNLSGSIPPEIASMQNLQGELLGFFFLEKVTLFEFAPLKSNVSIQLWFCY